MKGPQNVNYLSDPNSVKNYITVMNLRQLVFVYLAALFLLRKVTIVFYRVLTSLQRTLQVQINSLIPKNIIRSLAISYLL